MFLLIGINSLRVRSSSDNPNKDRLSNHSKPIEIDIGIGIFLQTTTIFRRTHFLRIKTSLIKD